MNISSFIGIALAGLTLWFGVFRATPDKLLFLDTHAIILVLGGTLAASFIAFPFKRLKNLVRFTMWGFLYKYMVKQEDLFAELLSVADTHYRTPRNPPQSDLHPFLSEALMLLANSNIDAREMRQLLSRRIETTKHAYRSDAKMLNALGKFPPAFGLLGASAGMIAMMMNLGKGGAESIGPSMAIALVATFWGIAVANLVILPLADFAGKAAQEEIEMRKMIMEVTLLMKHQESHLFVQDYIRSSVTPSLRFSSTRGRTSGANESSQKAA